MNAALVIDEGRLRPFVISRHNFLLMTSTKPPFDTTNRKSSYKSSVCLAMMGILLTGVPKNNVKVMKYMKDHSPLFFYMNVIIHNQCVKYELDPLCSFFDGV